MNKSRDKNFRIMKKTIMEKKEESPFEAKNLGMIMVTGLGQPSNFPSSLDQQITRSNLPPKFKSNIRGGSYLWCYTIFILLDNKYFKSELSSHLSLADIFRICHWNRLDSWKSSESSPLKCPPSHFRSLACASHQNKLGLQPSTQSSHLLLELPHLLHPFLCLSTPQEYFQWQIALPIQPFTQQQITNYSVPQPGQNSQDFHRNLP